jgi:hypothetical protein
VGHRLKQSVLRLLQTALRIGVPAMAVISIAAAIFEAGNPWPIADQYVPARTGEHRVLVGWSSQSTYSGDGSDVSASYILLPSFFLTGERLTVQELSDGSTKVERDEVFLPLLVGEILVLVALCVWAWITPRVPKPDRAEGHTAAS